MKSRKVVFSPEAEAQITALFRYIAVHASIEIAARYTDELVTFCERLRTFSNRGILRDDIRPGLRITSHRKRTAVAFAVEPARVVILGVFYGGQNYETALLEGEDEPE